MAVSAQGVIKTRDEQQFAFTMDMQVERLFASENTTIFRAGDTLRPVDPLVINFDGLAAELTDTRFSFDLDSDGTAEALPFVLSGSGLLVLDKNTDGKINNGSELFGPQTGNGLAELAAYDEDGNQWIDETDSVFNRLQVWTKDEAGNDALYSLRSHDIGAIYLGAARAQYTFKDDANTPTARSTRFGLYLRNTGPAGSLQQLDFLI